MPGDEFPAKIEQCGPTTASIQQKPGNSAVQTSGEELEAPCLSFLPDPSMQLEPQRGLVLGPLALREIDNGARKHILCALQHHSLHHEGANISIDRERQFLSTRLEVARIETDGVYRECLEMILQFQHVGHAWGHS